jgi:hypothetical protein
MQPHFAQRFHRDGNDALFALPHVQQRFQRGLAQAIVIRQPLRAKIPRLRALFSSMMASAASW